MPQALNIIPEKTTPVRPDSRSATLWNLLWAPRRIPGFGAIEAVVLGLYFAVLALTVAFHEQWADEAQAWLIARDSSLFDIFYRRLHYEGTPGLWHLILWAATRLHMPYGAMNWISAAGAAAGTYVFLRYAPFPPLIRYLLPFTFWLQYQYAVNARSYSLVPVFAFGLCALFAAEKPRLVLFALVAGLLANLTLYSALWAGTLTLLYCWKLWRERNSRGRLQSPIAAAALLCGLFLFAFYTALPAPDLIVRHDGAGALAHSSPLRDKLIPPTPPPPGWDNTASFKGSFPKDPPDVGLYTRGNAFQRWLMRVIHPIGDDYQVQTLGHRLSRFIIGPDALFFSISRSNLLGLAFLLAFLVWLAISHSLRFALPLLMMLILGVLTYINDHHAGLLFLSIIGALWLAWPDRIPTKKARLLTYQIVAILLLVVTVQQVGWSVAADTAEIREPFDPGRATAKYLAANGAGKRVIALGYETISAVPFLPANPFLNQPTSYWMYSENFLYWRQTQRDLAMHPDIFIVGAHHLAPDNMGNQIVPEIEPDKVYNSINPLIMQQNGYREVTRFCGRIFMRGSSGALYCNVVYVPQSESTPHGS